MNLDDLDYAAIGHWASTYEHCYAATCSLATRLPYKSEGGATFVRTGLVSPEIASCIPPGTGTWESPTIGLTLTNPGSDMSAVIHRTTWATVARWLKAWPAAGRDEVIDLANLITALTIRPDEHIESWHNQAAVADTIARRTARLEGGDRARIAAADHQIKAAIATRLRPDTYALF